MEKAAQVNKESLTLPLKPASLTSSNILSTKSLIVIHILSKSVHSKKKLVVATLCNIDKIDSKMTFEKNIRSVYRACSFRFGLQSRAAHACFFLKAVLCPAAIHTFH